METATAHRENVSQQRSEDSGLSNEHIRGLNILVADDEGMIGDVLKSGLELRLGCVPHIATSGDDALEMLRNEKFGLLITDLKMPGIHGFELVRAARAMHPHLGIIVMTGYRMEFPYLEAIRSGANDFIHKPFPLEELEAKIHRVVLENRALRERGRAERKYRSLFQHSVEGLVMLDDETMQIEDANLTFCDLMKATRDELMGQRVFEFCDEGDKIRLEHWLGMCKRIGRGRMNGIAFRRQDGHQIFVDMAVSLIKGDVDDILLISFTDVTDKLAVEQELANAAQRDEQTGLFNKRSFSTRIEGAVARGRRGENVTLLMIDLDNFKRCNDTHGHLTGDKLLKQVGGAVNASIRAQERDEGFRNGGDEFAVLLYGAPLETSVRIAERIQVEFAKGEAYGTSMSIGVCAFREGMSGEELIKAADEALYKAKRAGKNTVALADQA